MAPFKELLATLRLNCANWYCEKDWTYKSSSCQPIGNQEVVLIGMESRQAGEGQGWAECRQRRDKDSNFGPLVGKRSNSLGRTRAIDILVEIVLGGSVADLVKKSKDSWQSRESNNGRPGNGGWQHQIAQGVLFGDGVEHQLVRHHGEKRSPAHRLELKAMSLVQSTEADSSSNSRVSSVGASMSTREKRSSLRASLFHSPGEDANDDEQNLATAMEK